ncbi:MAG: chromosomal replication initiator protein DnaA [Planctomycetota bacterium]|nr:chromosomal replication initiator protein DnaA [Planctomycetota bacterium]
MTTDDMEIVSVLQTKLADKVGKERFELWFGQSTSLALLGDDLVVAVPSQFFRDFLRSSFRAQIESACFETFGRKPKLIFRIDESLPDPSESKPSQPAEASAQTTDSKQNDIKLFEQAAAGHETIERESASRVGMVAPRKFATLDGFIAGQSNQMAVSVARKAVEHPGHYSPLMFHGPTGVGKTHILEGIRTAARRRRGGPTAMYLTAEQFTTFFVDALRGSGLPSFRRKYRGVDILIIDDIQFFRGKRSTLVELHYTIDTLIREGRQVVLAADRPPSELEGLGAELITRIEGGMITPIEPPDRATRLGIVAKLAEQTEVKIPQDVQEFIASRLTSHARELSGALCRLQAASEAFARPITLDMAEEALADMVRHSGRLVRLPDIQRAVCDNLGLDLDSLQSARKAKNINHARMLAMWLARKHTRAALTEISTFFGRRSHSTVISAQRRVDGWIAAETPSRLFEDTSTIDETIRRIEQSLLAG